jgi:nucleotide-binding universal stress UspA family protein
LGALLLQRRPAMVPDTLHFLVAVDGSAHSLAAGRWIARLGAAGVGLRCTLINVQKPVGAIAPADIALEARERSADGVLEQASGILRPSGVRFDTEKRLDDTAAALVARARALDCDAIVVGRRGLGALRSALLGSVSAEVIRRSSVPVIVVSAASDDSASAAPRCLAAVDGSGSAGRAAVFASRLAAGARAGELHVLHVAQPFTVAGTIFGPRDRVVERLSGRHGHEVLEGVSELLDATSVPFVEHVDWSDDVVGTILKAAHDHSCSIVAMGTHGLGPLAARLLGSVAQGVLEGAERAGITLVLAR